MNYEQKYKEALERMKSWVRGEHPEYFCEAQKAAEFIFPELKESEDEKIRKGLINGFKECLEDCQYPKNAVKYWHNVEVDSILAWLEKQGKRLDADKVIEWIHKYWPCSWGNFTLQVDEAIEKFKKDFGGL